MIKIKGISDYPNQVFTLNLPNGETMNMTLVYKPLQLGWFVGITYKDFQVNLIRVTCNYNILEQFSNLIPFGLACFTNQNQEPFFVQDFQASNAALCILDETDLDNLEAFYAS